MKPEPRNPDPYTPNADKPMEVLMVVDSTQGQNVLAQVSIHKYTHPPKNGSLFCRDSQGRRVCSIVMVLTLNLKT